MWMRHIPMTFEDFQAKERDSKGFKYALKNIGLDSDVVRKRLIKGKTPWEDQEEQLVRCQKAYQEYHMTVPKTPSEIRAWNAYRGTTQAKSKVSISQKADGENTWNMAESSL